MNSNNTGTATAALVVGIVAFVCSWVFSSWGWLGTILGIVGIVLAANAFNECPAGCDGHGMAVAGLVLSILAVSLSALAIACVCGGMAFAFPFSCMACIL